MKKLAIVLLFFIIVSPVFAQKRISLGLRGGSGMLNYQVGLLSEFRITKKLFFQVEGNYLVSNKAIDILVYDQSMVLYGSQRIRTSVSYFQIPIMAKIKFGKLGKLYSMVGVAPSILIGSKAHNNNSEVELNYYDYTDLDNIRYVGIYAMSSQNGSPSEDISEFMKRVHQMVSIGFGYEKSIKSVNPFIEGRFYGLLNNDKSIFWQQPILFTICGGVKF